MITVECPTGRTELTDFVLFANEVNASRSAYWPAMVDMHLPFLLGEGAAAERRTIRPLVARQDGRIVARAVAVVDDRYIEHWNEPLGHVVSFEARPDSVDATRALLDEACEWLRGHGLEAARAGMGPANELAFCIDAYDALAPMMVRQNPAYYHSLLKEARFETERAWVDYKIEVTPELVARWEHMLAGAETAGYRILSLTDVPESRRLGDFAETWEDAFKAHWGMSPMSEGEFAEAFASAGGAGMYDASVLAYRGDEAVGVVWALPDLSWMALTNGDRQIAPSERLNFLGIGVRDGARGQGVNLAMAAKSYLGLVERGATHLSYTMVLDDNWPSRRTAEKLGARVCANYVVYRRPFARR
jgi:hypothetical protein